MFPKCPRFDGSVVESAPHAIEWSHCAQGWTARCFGFAQEVTAALALRNFHSGLANASAPNTK